MHDYLIAALVGLAVLLVGAIVTEQAQPAGRLSRTIPPAAEIPVANLPPDIREWNWGGGSCVHASMVMSLRWADEEQRAAQHRRKYSGGETASGLMGKLDRDGIPYDYTYSGDERFLEYVTKTRRCAVIFYYPSHAICFVGFCEVDGQEFAILLDNNRIDNFIRVPRKQFMSEWRGYGGFALAPLYSPTLPIPYSPWRRS